jgi:hypothetical protein
MSLGLGYDGRARIIGKKGITWAQANSFNQFTSFYHQSEWRSHTDSFLSMHHCPSLSSFLKQNINYRPLNRSYLFFDQTFPIFQSMVDSIFRIPSTSINGSISKSPPMESFWFLWPSSALRLICLTFSLYVSGQSVLKGRAARGLGPFWAPLHRQCGGQLINYGERKKGGKILKIVALPSPSGRRKKL